MSDTYQWLQIRTINFFASIKKAIRYSELDSGGFTIVGDTEKGYTSFYQYFDQPDSTFGMMQFAVNLLNSNIQNNLSDILEDLDLPGWGPENWPEFYDEYIGGEKFPGREYDPTVGEAREELKVGRLYINGISVDGIENEMLLPPDWTSPVLDYIHYPSYSAGEGQNTTYRPQGFLYYQIILDDKELFEDKDFYISITDYADGYGDIVTKVEKIEKGTKNNFDVNPPTISDDFSYFTLAPNPIYGSSVSFKSRLNYLQTIDNSLKILPSSENNLVSQFNFKWLLNHQDLGNLLKTIEIAGGYKNLKFNDPSDMYKDIIGLVENYSVNKNNQNLNETNISINVYSKAPIFNWKTSSFLNIKKNIEYNSFYNYTKHDFVYFDPEKYNLDYKGEKNKIDNFWFAKEDIIATEDYKFDVKKWTKIFNHDSKLPFDLNNKFDFYQMDYKNSYIQNIKYKENPNTLKQFQFKIENINNLQCRSILFFLEKKCGYRRFFYKFPFMFSGYKVFICTEWNHVFKYYDCNDITATFIEDPNVNSNNFKFIDYDYYHSHKLLQPYPQFLTSL
jgi:phage-related protein